MTFLLERIPWTPRRHNADSPSPIRQCAMVFLCSMCLNYNWEHSALNSLCRIQAGSLYKGWEKLAYTSLSTTTTQQQTLCWVNEISGDKVCHTEVIKKNDNFYYSLWFELSEASAQVSGWSWSRNVCGCADAHHQSPLHPIAFFICLFFCLLSESMLSTFREILEPLFISIWFRFSLSWKDLLISQRAP